jgi:hypothetical protein
MSVALMKSKLTDMSMMLGGGEPIGTEQWFTDRQTKIKPAFSGLLFITTGYAPRREIVCNRGVPQALVHPSIVPIAFKVFFYFTISEPETTMTKK